MDSQRILKPRGVTPLVAISAIDVLFLDYHKCLDLIFIHLSGLMIFNLESSTPEACLCCR